MRCAAPPTDCVIMAVREIMGSPPDLVLSGVNAGQNAADDVTYSGTVAGAIEGTLLGIPSIAPQPGLAHRRRQADDPFATAERHAAATWSSRLVGHGARAACSTT